MRDDRSITSKDNKDAAANFTPKEMSSREKVRIQYITFESMKANLHKVFGSKNQPVNSRENLRRNDAFAEMLFRYMSNCTDESIDSARVNYFEFLKKFDVIWPKKNVRKPNGG